MTLSVPDPLARRPAPAILELSHGGDEAAVLSLVTLEMLGHGGVMLRVAREKANLLPEIVRVGGTFHPKRMILRERFAEYGEVAGVYSEQELNGFGRWPAEPLAPLPSHPLVEEIRASHERRGHTLADATQWTDSHRAWLCSEATDRDVKIRGRRVNVVMSVVGVHVCMLCDPSHVIPAGYPARYEIDGEWGAFYCCIPGMDRWLDEVEAR